LSFPNTFGLFGLHVRTTLLRVLGLMMAIACGAFLRIMRLEQSIDGSSNLEDISSWILEVEPNSLSKKAATIVNDLSYLLQLAQESGNMIMHTVVEGVDVFQLKVDKEVYRYERAADPEKRFGVRPQDAPTPKEESVGTDETSDDGGES